MQRKFQPLFYNCVNNFKNIDSTTSWNIFFFIFGQKKQLMISTFYENWEDEMSKYTLYICMTRERERESLPLNLSRHRLGLAISPCIPGQYRFVFGCLWCCATWAAAAAAWCKSSNLKYGFTALFPPPPLDGGEAEVEWFVVEAILFVFVEAVAVSEVKARAAAADRRFRIVSMPCGLQCP